jgi:hypothetical protein
MALMTRAGSRPFILNFLLPTFNGFGSMNPQHARDEAKIRPRTKNAELRTRRHALREIRAEY